MLYFSSWPVAHNFEQERVGNWKVVFNDRRCLLSCDMFYENIVSSRIFYSSAKIIYIYIYIYSQHVFIVKKILNKTDFIHIVYSSRTTCFYTLLGLTSQASPLIYFVKIQAAWLFFSLYLGGWPQFFLKRLTRWHIV